MIYLAIYPIYVHVGTCMHVCMHVCMHAYNPSMQLIPLDLYIDCLCLGTHIPHYISTVNVWRFKSARRIMQPYLP